jgi:glycerol-3-phosphate acyltransferase PlsX
MRIAVDAMGGDYAPAAIVEGAIRAARELSQIDKIFLVGNEAAIKKELHRLRANCPKIEIRHCTEVVEMHESPAVAVRRKKDSSISRSVDLVKHREADALFSAGSTGAQVVASQLKLRNLEGVERPTIASVIPSPTKPFVLIDAGANPDCTPKMLLQFAVMGAVYAKEILRCGDRPRIGLMSNGEEDEKGNALVKETFPLLKASGLNFIRNIEGHDLFENVVDVVVCDGFVGNVILKTCENVAHAMKTWMKKSFTSNPLRMIGAACLSGAVKDLKRETDPAAYGGSLLMGVNGVSIIGHGGSTPFAVFNGIRVATEAVSHDINHLIIDGIRKLPSYS